MPETPLNANSTEHSQGSTQEHDEAPPQFGLVDVIEAFTAMRHEFRGQTKESRAAGEAIHTAVAQINKLEDALRDLVGDAAREEPRELVELIADVDHQLTRAIAGAQASQEHGRRCEAADLEAINRYFKGMSGLARWFARPLLKFVTGQIARERQATENSTIEGLNLILARLRRSMKGQRIERVETLGQPFDAETMNAIGTLETTDYPPGHVAEQVSPGYLWRGRPLRFADVRVAAPPNPSNDNRPSHASRQGEPAASQVARRPAESNIPSSE